MSKRTVYRATIVNDSVDRQVVLKLQAFRKDIFVNRLGWSLQTSGDYELDEFDNENAIHCGVFDGPELVGGFRAVRSDHPYLAATHFPHFASLKPFPRRADVWEISRFATKGESSDISRLTYGVMLRFARSRNASSLVALVDLHHERLLRRLGIKTRRFGAPQIVGYDRSGKALTAVAGEIPMLEQPDEGFQTVLTSANVVEMTDETLVRGRRLVSA